MKNELILILDFGGQYNQLIARRVRECNVYSEVVPYNISIEKIKEKNPKGIIFTGGPASVQSIAMVNLRALTIIITCIGGFLLPWERFFSCLSAGFGQIA